MKNILEVKHLTKTYPQFRLNDISMELPEGSVMGLIGANGAGKTTLIRLLTNMCNRDCGDILIFSKDNISCEREIKQDLGIVYDSNYFCSEWKVSTCEAALKGFFESWDSERFDELLKKFELKREQKIKTLSRGMAMKLMLAVSLSHNARFLILDEPTSGLDPYVRDELIKILHAYTQGSKCSVMFSTHITSDLEKIATHITFLHEGNLIFTGLKSNFINEFLGIRGDAKKLSNEQKNRIIGINLSGHKFEGMIKSKDKEEFPGFQTHPLTIEEIMLFVKEGNEYEA